jgi:hypothetical protein
MEINKNFQDLHFLERYIAAKKIENMPKVMAILLATRSGCLSFTCYFLGKNET